MQMPLLNPEPNQALGVSSRQRPHLGRGWSRAAGSTGCWCCGRLCCPAHRCLGPLGSRGAAQTAAHAFLHSRPVVQRGLWLHAPLSHWIVGARHTVSVCWLCACSYDQHSSAATGLKVFDQRAAIYITRCGLRSNSPRLQHHTQLVAASVEAMNSLQASVELHQCLALSPHSLQVGGIPRHAVAVPQADRDR